MTHSEGVPGSVLYPELEPFDSGTIDVGDGHALYWEMCGNPRGRPVVVLHGGPGSGCSPAQRRYFDPEAYCVVLFDQRGCGRSTPHAGTSEAALANNTSWHLLDDIERLRTLIGVDRWLVFGGSWGATLALLYAETHPERVSEVILAGVTTTRRREIDWLYRGGVAPLLPEAWEAFRSGAQRLSESDDIIDAYGRLLRDPDPSTRARAAEDWCRWESASVSSAPGPTLARRFRDPTYALAFARIVTHYFGNDAWLEDGLLLRNAGRLAGIPGIMVHGRLDVQAPLVTAWELKRAWPGAELRIVEGAGHSAGDTGTADAIVRATDDFARG